MMNKFGKHGTYKCGICDKVTRDTGRGEAEVELCAKCLYEAYVENAANDYGEDSNEFKSAVKNLEELVASQGGKK